MRMKAAVRCECFVLHELANGILTWPWRETSGIWWVRTLCWLAVLVQIFFIPATLWGGYGWEVATFFMFVTLIYSIGWRPNRE